MTLFAAGYDTPEALELLRESYRIESQIHDGRKRQRAIADEVTAIRRHQFRLDDPDLAAEIMAALPSALDRAFTAAAELGREVDYRETLPGGLTVQAIDYMGGGRVWLGVMTPDAYTAGGEALWTDWWTQHGEAIVALVTEHPGTGPGAAWSCGANGHVGAACWPVVPS